MTPLECWEVTRQAIQIVTGLEVIEAYDQRPADQRPETKYASLSLRKTKPLAVPTTEHKRVGDSLETSIIIPCEIEFDLTVRRADYCLDSSYLAYALSYTASTQRLFFENEMSSWGVKEHDREPEKVNQSYEDAVTVTLIIAAPLSTTDLVGYANQVQFEVNGLTGEVKPELEQEQS